MEPAEKDFDSGKWIMYVGRLVNNQFNIQAILPQSWLSKCVVVKYVPSSLKDAGHRGCVALGWAFLLCLFPL